MQSTGAIQIPVCVGAGDADRAGDPVDVGLGCRVWVGLVCVAGLVGLFLLVAAVRGRPATCVAAANMSPAWIVDAGESKPAEWSAQAGGTNSVAGNTTNPRLELGVRRVVRT